MAIYHHRFGKFGLALGSLLAFAAVSELATRLCFPECRFVDPRIDGYWISRLQLSNDFELVFTADTEHDPTLGWRMRRGYRTGAVSHNSVGFRGDHEYQDVTESFRIAVIGDSFAYGLGVPDEATFASRLAKLAGAEVINAGVNGYGLDQAILMWETEVRRFSPDLVILSYFVDDFIRSGLSVRDWPKPRFVEEDETGQYKLIGLPVFDEAERARSVDRAHLRTLDAIRWFFRGINRRLGRGPDSLLVERARLSAFLLERLRDSVRDNGGQLLVAIIPHCRYEEYAHGSWIIDRIIADCESLDVPHVVFSSDLSTTYEMYGSNCHWSECGHRVAAQLLCELIRSSNGRRTRGSRQLRDPSSPVVP